MATEKRLIDANELLELYDMGEELKEYVGMLSVPIPVIRQNIKDIPTVYAVEVVHGRNLRADSPSLFECSECGWSDCDTYTGDTAEYNYCPNCGAKMDGGADNG